MALRFESTGLTHQGLVRKANEDSHLDDKSLNLYVVCDGVGGQAAGHIASELCARSLRQRVYDHIPKIQEYKQNPSQALRVELATILRDAVLAANQAIYQVGQADPSRKGMCTTVVALLALNDYAILAHVGDSRIYLSRAGKVHQLTEDHQYGLEMYKKGAFTQEQLKTSPYSRVLTRAVGNHTAVDVDTLQIELFPGDRFFLCTDGVYQGVEMNEIQQTIARSTAEAAQDLINKSLERGGHDNATIVTVDVFSIGEESQNVLSVLRKTDVLQNIPLFRFLSYAEIQKVLELAQVRTFAAQEYLMREGEPSLELFIVASGKVNILKSGFSLTQKTAGDVLGQMGFFDQAPRSADVRADGPVQALIWARESWMALLRKEPSLAVKILWSVVSQLNADLRVASQEFVDRSLSAGEVSHNQGLSSEKTKDFPFPFQKKP